MKLQAPITELENQLLIERKWKTRLCVIWSLVGVAILGAVCLAGVHLPGWTRSGDAILAKVQETMGHVATAADTTNDVSTQALNLIGSVNVTVDRINGKNGKPGLLDKFNVTITKVDTLLDSADVTVKQVATTLKNVDAKTVESMQKLDETLTEIPITLRAGQGTMNETSSFIKGPLTLTLTDIRSDTHAVLQPTGLLITDFQHKSHEWMYPPKQSRGMQALKFARSVAPLPQPAYYGCRLLGYCN